MVSVGRMLHLLQQGRLHRARNVSGGMCEEVAAGWKAHSARGRWQKSQRGEGKPPFVHTSLTVAVVDEEVEGVLVTCHCELVFKVLALLQLRQQFHAHNNKIATEWRVLC